MVVAVRALWLLKLASLYWSMKFLPNKNTPRWIILLLDLGGCFFSLIIAYLLRFEFAPPKEEIKLALAFLIPFFAVRLVSFLVGRTYAGIIRYTSTADTLRIFTVVSVGSIIFAVANQIRFHFFDGLFFLPNSIIIIDYLLTIFLMVVSRIAIKVIYLELKNPEKAQKRVIIFGAGEGGYITKRTIDRDGRSGMRVVAFLDDDRSKSGKKMEGSDIYHADKMAELLASGNVDEIILATPGLSAARKAQLIKDALAFNVKVSQLPPATQWIGGELSVKQIRDIKIEDLLGREPIKLDSAPVAAEIAGKRVLVTGAAGSIGSELVRQIVSYKPSKLIVLDQAETPLFDLENELRDLDKDHVCEIAMGDVRQTDRMRRMMDYFKPQVVFHAAAYKHVPLMEDNPSEAILANVLGTKNLADLADEFGVEKFVLISTDKAVNPTSVMGATKRAAEIYVQSKDALSSTKYITTRFGNVLGSNGSVIPTFKRQIEGGGPITVTHEEVTRYFMTIPEAVQLVLEAGAMGQGGEIFAFDMGESVKIIDLAKNMIQLSGLELGKDIEIKITGLRPGEKLYEEVISLQEKSRPTHHSKIVIAEVRNYDHQEVKVKIEELIALFSKQNNESLVGKLKELIPEYVSNNSRFEQLDQK